MWTARGAYRDADGQVRLLSERSALWTDKEALLKEVEVSHPGILPCAAPIDVVGEWLRWVDQDGVERFVVVEEA